MIARFSFNVLRNPDPALAGGGTPPAAPAVSTTVTAPPADTGLTPDQQKVAAALGKIAETQPKSNRPIRGVQAPTAKALEGEFTDSDPEVSGDAPAPAKPAAAKVEPKTPADTKPAATAPAAAKPATAVKVADATKPAQRDYSGFAADEVEVLKQMSNPAFEFAAKRLREYKALQAQKGTPETFYQHAEGYTLAPDYREAQTTLHYLSREEAHWKQQLLNIRNAKQWHGLSGYDQQGQPILTGPFKPTDEAEIEIQGAIGMVSNNLRTAQVQRDGIAQNFQQRVQQDHANIAAEQAQRFEWVSKPEKLEEMVPVLTAQGPTEIPIKTLKADFAALFPTYLRSTIGVDVAANMWVALQIYAAKIRQLEASTQQSQQQVEEITRMEPTIDAAKGGGSSAAEFSMEGLPD